MYVLHNMLKNLIHKFDKFVILETTTLAFVRRMTYASTHCTGWILHTNLFLSNKIWMALGMGMDTAIPNKPFYVLSIGLGLHVACKYGFMRGNIIKR